MTKVNTSQTHRDTPTQSRGRARKRAILDSATRLFALRGFNKVSLAEIAADVGVTQAGLLYHYPTKAELLLAVLEERDERNSARLEESLAAGLTPLDGYFRLLAKNDEHPELVRLFVVVAAEALDPENPGHQWMEERDARLVHNMTGYVEEALDVELLPERITAEVVARWILALSVGLGAQWLRSEGTFDRAGQVALIMDLLAPYSKTPQADPAPNDRETTA